MTNNTTLSDEIQTMIKNQINTIPTPLKCTITKIYEDNKHVDIQTPTGELNYIETIGNQPEINKTGILIFLNGTYDEHIIII